MLRAAGHAIRRPSSTLAMPDHSVPTKDRAAIRGGAAAMVEQMRQYAADAGITFFGLDDARHGIVHVVGPEQASSSPAW